MEECLPKDKQFVIWKGAGLQKTANAVFEEKLCIFLLIINIMLSKLIILQPFFIKPLPHNALKYISL